MGMKKIEINKIDNTEIYEIKLHKVIQKELTEWKKYCDDVRKNPLGWLKGHHNVGYDPFGKQYNTFQTNLPFDKVINSYWLALTLIACSRIWGGVSRDYRLQFRGGHNDHLDIWINYCDKGSCNPRHTHGGNISGVIYYKNDDVPTVFPDYGLTHYGKNSTMVLFKSDTVHYVPEKTTKAQRITFAFNIKKGEHPKK